VEHEHGSQKPQVIDRAADARFHEVARAQGYPPEDQLVGGYVDWEWQRARHMFDGLFGCVHGKQVLEFGSHLGGTAIVVAALGAEVTGVDVDPRVCAIAEENVARYGMADRIRIHLLQHTKSLPFPDARFDVISCTSVLEYVPSEDLEAVLHELDRVLAPGGLLTVFASGNRLFPREQHLDRWLINYVPRGVDKYIWGRDMERGVEPWRIRRALPGYTDLTLENGGRALVELKRRTGAGPAQRKVIGLANRMLTPLGLHYGYIAPHVVLALRKP
jgi:ubiquinone/menaquinone biosynthesis C-methylase UbiE